MWLASNTALARVGRGVSRAFEITARNRCAIAIGLMLTVNVVWAGLEARYELWVWKYSITRAETLFLLAIWYFGTLRFWSSFVGIMFALTMTFATLEYRAIALVDDARKPGVASWSHAAWTDFLFGSGISEFSFSLGPTLILCSPFLLRKNQPGRAVPVIRKHSFSLATVLVTILVLGAIFFVIAEVTPYPTWLLEFPLRSAEQFTAFGVAEFVYYCLLVPASTGVELLAIGWMLRHRVSPISKQYAVLFAAACASVVVRGSVWGFIRTDAAPVAWSFWELARIPAHIAMMASIVWLLESHVESGDLIVTEKPTRIRQGGTQN